MKPTRRELLGAGLAAAAGALSSTACASVCPKTVEGVSGTISSQMKLSLAAYSFRKYLPRDKKAGTMSLHNLLDLAASWRLDALEPTAYYFDSEETDYLHSLKAKAFKLGLDISGTAVGNNFCLPPGETRDGQVDYVKRWVDHAVEFGAPCIRVFAGHGEANMNRDEVFGWVTDCMKQACDYAGSRGVFLAIENHGYLTETAENVLRIVDAINHEWFGVNLDTGNFAENPYEGMAVLAPKAITVQVKVEVRTPTGKTEADFDRITQILRDANYRGYVALEYEADDEPMTAVPAYLDKLRKALNA
ncbi:MAG TPA: sugar phosphate isomerase/epimerase family protein [Candidatus Hydrogenedentes bacterium]|nr:sugar phosphate isomerase/epimerase family protein [Candidatus Hydrogenedentota bacterium]HPG65555.1 sugar phosphate isomerase/epimerase family protein [Candidatus Hydrogenedentota bacterium]